MGTTIHTRARSRMHAAPSSVYASILLLAGASAITTPVFSAALDLDRAVSFAIERQPIESALLAFSKQSNIQIIISPSVNGATESSGLSGTVSPRVALDTLLRGTGLRYAATGESVTITKVATSSQSGGNPGSRQGARGPELAQTRVEATAANARENTHQKDFDEVVVTAQKRAEKVIDVPISIVVMTNEELTQRRITGIDDLQFVVPGLALQSNGETRRIFLRGVANDAGGSSLVGIYLDEADLTAAPNSQLDLATYDLERVEVLRGPQGTLYGEGSAGGTIRFITKNPNLRKYAFESDVAALFTQEGGAGQRVEQVVNVPLIPDTLGIRIAGTFDHDGGWIDQPTAGLKNINDQNRTDVRAKVLWQATSEFTANAMMEIHRNDLGPNYGEDSHGNFTQSWGVTTTPREQDDFNAYNLTLSYDLPSVRVLSTTSYFWQDQKYTNFGYPYLNTFQIQGPVTIKANVFTEELRLSSSGSAPWQWTFGGFYRHETRRLNDIYLSGPAAAPPPTLPLDYAQSTAAKKKSVFGDSSYKLTTNMTVGAGVRYFVDDEGPYATGCCGIGGPLNSPQSGRFHSLDPRVHMEYRLTDGVNIYTSAAKGFRSGGFNALNQPTYGPESLWTYELGSKMSVFEGHLTADTAVFLTNYSNYQATGTLPPPAPSITIISNAGRARIKGIETDVSWRPTSGWTLSFTGNYIDAKVVSVDVLLKPNGLPSTPLIAGDTLDYVPKYTFTASLKREFEVNDKEGSVRLDYNQQGHETFRGRNIGPLYFGESDVIRMLNFNAQLQMNANLSLSIFAQNLLNDRGYTDPITNTVYGIAARSRPRTYGIGFGVNFD